MNTGFRPKVSMPNLSNDIAPMRSDGFQPPFYFGGSQVPNDLHMPQGSFSGSGVSSYSKLSNEPSITSHKSQPIVKIPMLPARRPMMPSKIKK